MSYKEEYERLLLEKSDLRKKKNKTVSKLKQMLFDEEVKNSNLVKCINEIVKDLIQQDNEEHTRDMLFEIQKLINP